MLPSPAARALGRPSRRLDSPRLSSSGVFADGHAGLQTQPDKNRLYNGPFDAIKKIYSSHGLRGLFKGQNVTFLREATGYGVYFLAYEKLVQREMTIKGIRRDQISPANAVLYGAAAGYAVRSSYLVFVILTDVQESSGPSFIP
jgi:hypothetical protein